MKIQVIALRIFLARNFMTHFFANFSTTVHPYKSRSVFRKTPFSQKFTSTFQPSRGKTARISTLSLLTSLNPKCAAFSSTDAKEKVLPPRLLWLLHALIVFWIRRSHFSVNSLTSANSHVKTSAYLTTARRLFVRWGQQQIGWGITCENVLMCQEGHANHSFTQKKFMVFENSQKMSHFSRLKQKVTNKKLPGCR